MRAIGDPVVVYLGGLFHDIAKGRGGDHSELGAVDAEAFCLEHGMTSAAAETVCVAGSTSPDPVDDSARKKISVIRM